MARKKTHEEFVTEVKALVGDEYTVVGTYEKSDVKVEMRHTFCGNTFHMKLNHFFSGRTCPHCNRNGATKRTYSHELFVSKARNREDINEYRFLSEYTKSNEHVRIQHIKCGHIYSVTPSMFLSGRRCPECATKERAVLQTRTPSHFKYLISNLGGGEYNLVDEYVSSKQKVKIIHSTCGHVYEVVPISFLRGHRCPSCARKEVGTKLTKTQEQFEREVYEKGNGEYVVLSKYKTANKKVSILHKKCGNIYDVKPYQFVNSRSRCPVCRASKGETEIAYFLKTLQIPYEREYKIFTGNKVPMRLDFYVNGIAIEYDGELHYKAVEHFGGETALRETQRRDRIKDKYCADNGIPLIRIPYWDFDNIDAILTEKLLPLLNEQKAS